MKELLFNKSEAVAALNHVEGFNPIELARRISNEGQEEQLYLDVKYRKLWFRLVHPAGKVISRIINFTETMAIVEARVYLDKADSTDNYIANSFSQKFRSEDPQFGDKFLEMAETAAIGRALADAGFGLQFADVGEGNDPAQVDAGIPLQQTVPFVQSQNDMMGQFYHQAQMNGSMIGQTAASPSPQMNMYGNAMYGAMQGNGMPMQNQNFSQSAVLDESRPIEELEKMMTYEQATKVVVNFGKNKGKTMGQIAIENPSYIEWFVNEYRGNNHLISAAARILMTKGKQIVG